MSLKQFVMHTNKLYPKRVLWFAALAALLASQASAQEERAVVTGTISDPSKLAIVDASIEIDNSATGFHREVKTNDSGLFLVPGLLVGVYDLHVTKAGFASLDFKAFEL